MITTTFKLTEEEHSLIKARAEVKGMTFLDYVNMKIDKNLPVKEIPYHSKNIARKTRTIEMPSAIHKRLIENKEVLKEELRPVKLWEIILYCAVEGHE